MSKLLKKCSIILLIFTSILVRADDTAVQVRGGVTCSSILDMEFFYFMLSKKYGAPVRKEGAYWFKAGLAFYGQTADEVFIADGSSAWNFVGVVLSGKPPELAETIRNTPGLGMVFRKSNVDDPYSPYHSQNGSEILWFGESKSKLLCKIKSNYVITN